jgi:hypothetical protein
VLLQLLTDLVFVSAAATCRGCHCVPGTRCQPVRTMDQLGCYIAVLAGSRRSTITKDTVPTAAAAGAQRPRKSSASGTSSVCSGSTGQTQQTQQQQQQQQRDYVREQREAKGLQQRCVLCGSPPGGYQSGWWTLLQADCLSML